MSPDRGRARERERPVQKKNDLEIRTKKDRDQKKIVVSRKKFHGQGKWMKNSLPGLLGTKKKKKTKVQ